MNLIKDDDLGGHLIESVTAAHFTDPKLISDHVNPAPLNFTLLPLKTSAIKSVFRDGLF